MSGTATPTRRRRGEAEAGREDEVDPRLARRRTEVGRAAGRRRTRRLVVAASVATVLATVWALLHSPLADIDQVVVHGATHVGDDAVRQASGLAVGDPIVGRNADAVAGAESLSWVADAQVERDLLGGVVTITVTERSPVAAIATPDDTWLLVDDAGVAVATVSDRPSTDQVIGGASRPVPMVAIEGVDAPEPGGHGGTGLRGALDVIAALDPGVATRIDVVRVQGDQLELGLRPSGTVRFGRPEQIDAKIRSLQAALAQVDLTDLCAIDLRVPSSTVVDRSQPCA